MEQLKFLFFFLSVLRNFAEPKKSLQERLLCNSASLFDTHILLRMIKCFSLSLFFFREAEDSLSITVARCTSVNFYVPCVSFTLLDPKTLSFLWDIPQVINREGKGQRGQLPGSVA